MLNERDSVTQRKMSLSGFVRYWSCRGIPPKFIYPNSPHSARFHLIRGRILLRLGRHEQAVSDFRTALRLNWRHEQAARWLNKAEHLILCTDETGSLT